MEIITCVYIPLQVRQELPAAAPAQNHRCLRLFTSPHKQNGFVVIKSLGFRRGPTKSSVQNAKNFVISLHSTLDCGGGGGGGGGMSGASEIKPL
jgi:hypothetical protein